jgi:AmmeMemoRadiSam system protein B
LLAGAKTDGPAPAAIIAPHAGYVYSGPVAASAYARLSPLAGKVKRVVLIGPAHRLAFRGIAVSDAESFATPAAVARIAALPQVKRLEEAFDGEHCLEVHLPFLQIVLGAFELVPLVAGEATGAEVEEVLDLLWDSDETLPVISSDLSHYHDYETARRQDRGTARAIEALDDAALGWDDACGRVPISGLLRIARRRSLAAVTVDLRNSGDTAGPKTEVVGYGAWVLA